MISTLRLLGRAGFQDRPGVHPRRRARPRSPARLLQAALAEVGDRPCRISAQTYLAGMRPSRVHPDGAEFLEDGIPHVPMVRGASMNADRLSYPFSAIVGHDRLRLALVLCAVRPEIGGC